MRLEAFEELLRNMVPSNFDLSDVLRSKSGRIATKLQMQNGEIHDQAIDFYIYHEHGFAQIKPFFDLSGVSNQPAEDQIQQTIGELRGLVREYWMRNKIKTKIEDLEQYLKDRFYGDSVNPPNENFATLEKYFAGVIDTDEMEFSTLPLRAVTGSGTQMHLPAVVMILLYCMEADEALAMEEHDEAWYWASRAKYWSSPIYLREDPNKRTKDRASAAAKARTEAHVTPLKKMIGEILKDPKTPVFGKMSKIARHIADKGKLWQSYVEVQGNEKREEDWYLNANSFEKTIYSWIREDETLRLLFEEHQVKRDAYPLVQCD